MPKEKYFFENFKEIRKSKKKSIKKIVEETKLQKHYIIAIEKGDFTVIPQVYVRLFLKSYCNCLGLDIEKILLSYEQHISGNSKSNKGSNDKTPQFMEQKTQFKKSILLDNKIPIKYQYH